MKKMIITYVILAIVAIIAIVVTVFGFGLFSVAAIPFQDPQYVPASALVRQNVEMIIGAITMTSGIVAFAISVVVGVVVGIVSAVKGKKRISNEE